MNETQSDAKTGVNNTTPHFKRVLSLWDLFLYGIVAVTPSAPVTIFGLAYLNSQGHALLTILIGMVAMLFTAVSYGRMASLFPSAGSAYTYVGLGLNPFLGFLAGWAMLLDYILIPLFCVMYASLSLQRILPGVPFIFWVGLNAGAITFFNLMGIRSTARTNKALVGAMMVVLIIFVILAVKYLFAENGWPGIISFKPFYNPETFDWTSIAKATSLAALTYTGFDSLTTLAEDVKNPRRNVLLAIVLVCLFVGIFGGLLIYLSQLVWPDYNSFTNIETAFMDITQRVGGVYLFQAIAILLVVAMFGSALNGQVGGARLLFGMGRDNALPRKIFAYLSPKRNTPDINIIMIGLLAFIGAQTISYELAAHLLNFGAFLGFMGVNFAAFWQFFVKRRTGYKRKIILDLFFPIAGFLFCFGIWWGLEPVAKIAGGCWYIIGLIYLLIKTKGFKGKMVVMDFSES